MIQHKRGRRNRPSPNVSCAFRPWPLLAGAHTLAQPRIPEDALITNRVPLTSLGPHYKCIRFPTRTPPASFVLCEQVTYAQLPCVQGLVYPALHCCPTIRFRNLSLTWSASGDRASHGPAACAGFRLPAFPTGLCPDCHLLSCGRSLSHCFQPAPPGRSAAGSCQLASGRLLSDGLPATQLQRTSGWFLPTLF